MSFGDGDLHVKAVKLQDRVDSLEVTNGELCAEINRQERRIRQLEALVRDTHRVMWACREVDCSHRENGCFRVKDNGDGECWFEQRMCELGIEVG